MKRFVKSKILLGSGTFASVYAAAESNGDNGYAWKELKNSEANSDYDERFIREVHILSTLKHPNIVPIAFSSLVERPYYFIMPKAERTLTTAIRFSGITPIDRNGIFRQICWGVEYAHDNGVLHRDLKPDNVLLFPDGTAKISDFGLAKKSDASLLSLTNTNDKGGTHGFTAPEQWSDSLKNVSEATDIYSLGKILYVLHTGANAYHIQDDHPELLPGIKYIVLKATAVKPEDRFGSISEMLESFELAVGNDDALSDPQIKVESLIQKFYKDGTLRNRELAYLDNLFRKTADDAAFYLQVFPLIPVEIWKTLYERDKIAFRRILEAYDQHASVQLPFNYTDRVAGCYAAIYRVVQDSDVSMVILNRLLIMGFSHNRWFVRSTLEKLLKCRPLDGLVCFRLRDVIRQNREAANWSFENLLSGALPVIIADELGKAG
jgi:hypothetical protein